MEPIAFAPDDKTETQMWLEWLETSEGRQWAAGFDYFVSLLNDTLDETERQSARNSLTNLLARAPQGKWNKAMAEVFIALAEQRQLK